MFLRRDVGITQNGGAGGSGSGAGGGSASNGASTSSSMASTPLSAATFDASGLVVPPAALGGAGAAATAVNVDATLQAFRGNAFATTSNGSNMSLVSAHAGPSASGAARGISLHQPSLAERAVDAFYFYFHPGHPFVLPKEYLLRLSKEQDLRHLMAAIRYIGSLYLEQPGGSGPTRATFFDEAVRLAYAPTTPRDGFLVQTLLLLAIGLDGDCQQDRARQMLAVLERTALEINIHMREYATLHGRGNPVVEESWRRTWWDLYVVDGMIAGVHRATTFLLFDVPSDVGLPCEEAQYLSGVCLSR